MNVFSRGPVFRSAANPPSAPPKRLRMSMVARWFWCAEQTRHMLLGLVPEREETEWTRIGTELHQKLEESMGRRFPWEQRMMEKLQKHQDPELGFKRKLYGSTIYFNLTGHPDDLQILRSGGTSVVEHKTVLKASKFMIDKYKLPLAKFQAQGYAWILEPIIQKIGGFMNREHAVAFWKMEGLEPISDYEIAYYGTPAQVPLLS